MRSLPALLLLATLLPPLAAAQEQVHLGLRETHALDGYTVSWLNPQPTGPTTLTFHGPDGDEEIDGRRVDGPSAGLVYEATLPPLARGRPASYTLGGATYEIAVPEEAPAPLRIVALGDMGVTREAGAAVEAIAALEPHLVLHAGDVSYAEGDPTIWEAWFELVQPVASRVPWVPAIGNHEADIAGLSTDEASAVNPAEQAFFKQRFPVPSGRFYHSFDVGGVHVVALDTFSELTVPEAQIAWLREDLAGARDADWIVAYLHEPPYSSNAAHGSSIPAYDAYAAILEEAGVDLVLAAHDHAYERSHVLRSGQVVGSGNETLKGAGTRYVVTGGGGAPLYSSFVEPQPGWSAAREAVFHVLLLEAAPQRLDVRVVPTVEPDAQPDAFSIVKPMAAAPPTPASETPAPSASLVILLALPIALALARASGPRRGR